MPDENVIPSVHNPPDVQTKTGGTSPCPPRSSAPEKVADKPHPRTILLGLFSPSIAVVAVVIALLS